MNEVLAGHEAEIRRLLAEHAVYMARYLEGGEIGLQALRVAETETRIRSGNFELNSLKKQWRLPKTYVDQPTKLPPFNAEDLHALISHAAGCKPLGRVLNCDLAANLGRISLDGPL